MASERVVPIWFGPRVSPLFGVVHMPDERARGAVVLCPPLGREYICSHSTSTKLAIRLAQLGFVALRFDYRSTGDSFDRTGDGSDCAGFVKDIGSAVSFVRTMGVARVGIVGMRLGASFAARQCSFEPVDALVLWDACSTGRSFLREQWALGLVAGVHNFDESASSLELPRLSLSREMASEISALDLIGGQPRLGRKNSPATCSCSRDPNALLIVHLPRTSTDLTSSTGRWRASPNYWTCRRDSRPYLSKRSRRSQAGSTTWCREAAM